MSRKYWNQNNPIFQTYVHPMTYSQKEFFFQKPKHIYIRIYIYSLMYMDCFHCGSTHTIKCGFKIKVGGIRRQRWQCQSCGKNFLTDIQVFPSGSCLPPSISLSEF